MNTLNKKILFYERLIIQLINLNLILININFPVVI